MQWYCPRAKGARMLTTARSLIGRWAGASTLAVLLAGAALMAPGTASAAGPAPTIQLDGSGWLWASPLPQGNDLHGLSFAGGTGYAVGDAGTLLKTADAGRSWSSQTIDTVTNLAILQTIDAHTLVVSDQCRLWRSTDGAATFTRFAPLPAGSKCEDFPVIDVAFSSANDGYVLLTDGTVLATSDGGAHLERRATVPGILTPGFTIAVSLTFLTPTIGFVTTTDGRILRTDDGARSWQVVANGRPPLYDIAFPDAEHGYAIGANGLLMRSADGGSTWQPHDLHLDGLSLERIVCTTPQACTMLGDGGESDDENATPNVTVLHTSDGGESVRVSQVPGGAPTPVQAIAAASASRVVAVGAFGRTFASDDAGAHFGQIGQGTLGSALSVGYGAVIAGGRRGTAYATTDAGLLMTRDGGRSWHAGGSPRKSFGFDSVSFPTPRTGYAVAGDGSIFRTTNGTRSWRRLRMKAPMDHIVVGDIASVAAPSPRDVLLIGPNGILRSTNAGRTFTRVRSHLVARAELFGVVWMHGRQLLVEGLDFVARSGNSGRTWSALRVPHGIARKHGKPQIEQVAFGSRTTGLLLDSKGRLWRTTSGGRRWTRLHRPTRSLISSLTVGSLHDMYLAEGFSGLLHSRDGGRTWQTELSGIHATADALSPFEITATSSGTDYLVLAGHGLLSTRTGGVAVAHPAVAAVR